jgi:hypothetical protein
MLSKGQIKKLEKKHWTVKPNGYFIKLYRDDYKDDTWNEICKEIGCSNQSTEVTVLSFGYTNKIN